MESRQRQNAALIDHGQQYKLRGGWNLSRTIQQMSKGKKWVAVRTGGKEKERVTAELTCFDDGPKLPPITSYFEGGEVPRNQAWTQSEQADLPPGVLISVNEEAYVYEEEMTGEWKQSVIDYLTQQRCAGEEGKHNTLLLLNDYKVHKLQAARNHYRQVEYISKRYLADWL